MTTFLGFPRKYGPAGIRNHVLVISGELSCNPWALEIASPVKNCYAMTHKNGMGNFGPDRDVFLRITSGIMSHPNVGGLILVSSGNEDYDPSKLINKATVDGRKAYLVSLQKQKNVKTIIKKGIKLAQKLVDEINQIKRIEVGLNQLRVGLNCAGTDTFSKNTSHAVSAAAMDQLVEYGGTVVLSEIPEMIGLDETFFSRSATKDIKKKLKAITAQHKRRLLSGEEDINKNELCPFNFQGGLSSLKEKSRISVIKGGKGTINAVLAYGQLPSKPGLVIMDGPAMTDFVMTGLMGAGVHLMISCSGVGVANKMPIMVGADSTSPILPVIKVTGSTHYFNQKENKIDFNAGTLLIHPDGLPQRGMKLLKLIIDVASGKMTCTEKGQNFFVNFPMQFHQA